MRRIDQFAEYLAQGLSITQIREKMGLTRGSAQSFMWRIRQQLGDQAR